MTQKKQSDPKFPDAEVTIDLGGPDGNAFVILAKTKIALKGAGASDDDVTEYLAAATGDDYDKLLAVTREWVTFNT